MCDQPVQGCPFHLKPAVWQLLCHCCVAITDCRHCLRQRFLCSVQRFPACCRCCPAVIICLLHAGWLHLQQLLPCSNLLLRAHCGRQVELHLPCCCTAVNGYACQVSSTARLQAAAEALLETAAEKPHPYQPGLQLLRCSQNTLLCLMPSARCAAAAGATASAIATESATAASAACIAATSSAVVSARSASKACCQCGRLPHQRCHGVHLLLLVSGRCKVEPIS
ncbi:hypothetical protein COO60DRAFT_759461 [Scenedesmus sp. NREL 46B-D3]|nr:hypothetical protein COO60DRAFT_759461 [Scenedesmus sp. NREL 46B-D3]